MDQAVGVEDESSTLQLRRRGVVRAVEAMRRCLADSISLEQLADAAAMSRSHFERVFQQITGLSPFQFLSSLRLVRARDLVLDTDASIADICFDVGYNSIGTFTRRFTEAVGVSPMRLRWFTQSHRVPLSTAGAAAGVRSGAGASVVVQYRGSLQDSRVYVGAFPSRVPIGRPSACVTVAGSGTVLRGLPLGVHYLLGAAQPVTAPHGRFGDYDTLVGFADPSPVRVTDQTPMEVTMQLRPIELTDPPIVSFLPLAVHEHELEHDDERLPGMAVAGSRVAGTPAAARSLIST